MNSPHHRLPGNAIARWFAAMSRHFGPEGRLHRWEAFFEAIETVFFAPADLTAQSPHPRDHLDVKRYMATVVFSLVPLLFFGIYNAGHQSRLAAGLAPDFWADLIQGSWIVLPLVIVSYAAGFGWEILFAAVRRHEISEGVFVTAMLFPLTLPPTTPLWQAALGISFGVVIGKEIFGGTGRNFLNPALTGRAFLYFAYPAQMSGDAVWTAVAGGGKAVDAFSAATPLALAPGVRPPATVEAVLSFNGYDAWRLFWGLYPDSIGASSTCLCLLAAALLIALGIASYRIIIGGVAGVLITGWFLNLLAEPTNPFMMLNPVYHLLIGGAAFGITFMATDPVSAPDLNAARWIYGFAIGALTVVIRVFNPAFPEGIMMAILFMNVFAPLLDRIAVYFRLKRRIANV